ncbi:MAG: hypothetical protein R3C17_12565 [Planctomycetaceae bacterium]
MSEPQPPEDNPYVATQVTDVATSEIDRRKPSTVAVVLSVILGLVAGLLAFGATFFFTCLGVASLGGMDSGFGVLTVFSVSVVTGLVAFVFTIRGFLMMVGTFKV